jgi:hypothetical protein
MGFCASTAAPLWGVISPGRVFFRRQKMTSQKSQGSNPEQIKKAIKDWFLRQNYAAKLTAVLLYELTGPDRGSPILAEEILKQFKNDILHNTKRRTAKSKNNDDMKVTFLSFLACLRGE